MKIPHTVNKNYFKVYEPSSVALSLVPESRRIVKSENKSWDETHLPRLTELCLLAIIANFENRIILNELPCWDKSRLLEILPMDLPLPLVIEHIQDEFYWKRKVEDRWPDNANYCQDFGNSWKRMYLERHTQEAVEAMTPEGFDLDTVNELCNMTKDYVKILNLRELQIMQPIVIIDQFSEEAEDTKDPCEHIDLGPIIVGLENLTELHVQFGLRNVGSDYKKSWFEFSLQDCENLGAGVSKSNTLKLLRVHSCNLNDEKLNALLSNMTENHSLEELNFSNCLIEDNGAAAIARYLKNRYNIKTINLRSNKIGEVGIASIAFILTQSHTSPVENLNLKYNMFGDAGFKFLASALIREKPVISTLNVSCCNLKQESGILLAETLKRNFKLTNINMANNSLGESAGRALENAMKDNRTVQFLDLRMTEISDEDYFEINEALHFNRIRAVKGEKGVEREIRLREKRAEDERRRLEQEAIEAARAAEEEALRLLQAAEETAEEDED